MKIGSHSSPAADAAALSRANAEAGAAAAKARGPLASEDATSVQLSSAAAGLMAGGNSADFDAAKVERMKQSIADGSYRVDAGAIADKLISNAQEVLGATRR